MTSSATLSLRLCLLALLACLLSLTASTALAQDEIVQDGSFEAGTPNPAWDESSNGPGGTPICSSATCGGGPNGAFDGDWWLWFGRGTDNKIASVTQEVTIPNTVNSLSFYLQIPVADKAGTLRVQIDGSIVFQATQANAGDYEEYEQVAVDVSNFADGQAHTLTFLGVIGASQTDELVSFFVDEVALEDLDTTAPAFSVAPDMLSFTVEAGQVSEAQTLTLTNSGDAEGTYSVSTSITPKQGLRLVPRRPAGSAAKTLAGPMPPTSGTPVRSGEIVADGSFEAGTPNPAWDEASSNFQTPLCTSAVCAPDTPDFQPRTGAWWTWFGGANSLEIGSIEQDVTVPSGTATLVFWLRIPTANAPGTLDVLMDGENVFAVTEADAASYPVYTEVMVDISDFADGDSHTLRFESTQDGTAGVTNFFLDDVSITTDGGGGGDSVVIVVDPEEGTVEAGDTEEISVTADATDAEPGTYLFDLFIATDDPDNPELIVGVTVLVEPDVATEGGAGGAAFVFDAYPNPFADRATLSYTLPEAAAVRVEVYDVTGRLVATLVDAPQGSGPHEVEWDAADLPSGVYLYRIEAGRFSETHRTVLVR